jgi:hypothetical protein
VCVSKVSVLYIIAWCSANKTKTNITRRERERERERERSKNENRTENEIWAGKRISGGKPNLRRDYEIGRAGGTSREPRIEVVPSGDNNKEAAFARFPVVLPQILTSLEPPSIFFVPTLFLDLGNRFETRAIIVIFLVVFERATLVSVLERFWRCQPGLESAPARFT